jgi:hypothetical protein
MSKQSIRVHLAALTRCCFWELPSSRPRLGLTNRPTWNK